MIWHDLVDANDPKLDELALEYHLHPLHIEDCRHGDQRAKVEEGADYLFVVLRPVHINASGELEVTDVDIFLGRDFLITVQEGECSTLRDHLDHLSKSNHTRPDILFYKVFDSVVDAYVPPLDWFNDTIDEIEDVVLEKPDPSTLQRIFKTKRALIELRRILSNTRDVAGHVQRLETDLIQRDLWPFLRDVYDHLARSMDLVEMQRDLLTGAMDIYLSSVANRTNEVMKVLTILGTIALPSLVVSGFYGMNMKGIPFIEHPHAAGIAIGLMAVSTALLLVFLKKFKWL